MVKKSKQSGHNEYVNNYVEGTLINDEQLLNTGTYTNIYFYLFIYLLTTLLLILEMQS
jgi:hypothetical protein